MNHSVLSCLLTPFELLQNLIMQNVDHSAGDLIHLLQGLLRYDPTDRLTAREALRHPFFCRDHQRR
jgi:dual-specificity kinase